MHAPASPPTTTTTTTLLARRAACALAARVVKAIRRAAVGKAPHSAAATCARVPLPHISAGLALKLAAWVQRVCSAAKATPRGAILGSTIEAARMLCMAGLAPVHTSTAAHVAAQQAHDRLEVLVWRACVDNRPGSAVLQQGTR